MNYTRKEQIANGSPIPPLTESERLTKALAGAGGNGLPDYSEASVGDVLTLASTESVPSGVEPKWSAPSGGGIMYVTISYDEVDGEPVYSADKTLDEIIAAVEAGQDVRATMAQGGGYYYLISCSDDSASKHADFNQITVDLNEDSPTTAHLGSTDIYMSNEGSGDVVSVHGMEGDIAITIS